MQMPKLALLLLLLVEPMTAPASADPPCAYGDVNSDGLLNLADLPGLVECLIDNAAPQCNRTDVDGDGSATLHDFASFQRLFGSPIGTPLPYREYIVGTLAQSAQPWSLAFGDIDSDDDQDMLVVTRNSGQLYTLTNDGSGQFSAGPLYEAGNNPEYVTMRDLNNDDHLDAVVAHNVGGASIFLNRGDGSFAGRFVVSGGNSIAIDDLNGDGTPDLALARDFSSLSALRVRFNAGDAEFAEPVDFPIDGNGVWTVTEDFDGDDDIDVAIAHTGHANPAPGQVSILLNQGDGTFGVPSLYPIPADVWTLRTGDLNGDGFPDLVSTHDTSGGFVTVLMNVADGTGTFAPYVAYGADSATRDVTIGDLTGDGMADLAVASSCCGTSSVLTNNGNGTFGEAVPYTVGRTPNSCTMADVNADGHLDLAVVDSQTNIVSILVNEGGGIFPRMERTDFTGFRLDVRADDFNSDGNEDLLVSPNGSDATIFLTQGDGSLTDAEIVEVPGTEGTPFVYDVNLDGKPDLITLSTNGAAIRTGNGDGTFGMPVNLAAGDLPNALAAGDLDGKGVMDLAVVSEDGRFPFVDTLHLFIDNGTGLHVAQPAIEAGDTPVDVAIADVNADLHFDVIVVNEGDDEVSIHANMGDGVLADSVSYTVCNAPSAVAVGDLNGDGGVDLVVSATGVDLGCVCVLLNQLDGTFSECLSYEVGRVPTAVELADLTGDGLLDITTVNVWTKNISILVNLGSGDFAPAWHARGVLDNRAISLADFNGDGDIDIAIGGENQIGIMLNQCIP